MNNLPDAIAQAPAPWTPPKRLNDDDLFIVDVRSKKIVIALQCRTDTARVGVGQALVTGMQARFMGVES